MYSTRQIVGTKRRTVFACFKTYVNCLSQSALYYDGITSYIAQTQHFRESRIPKDPLREKCPNTEIFLVRILLYSD